MQAQKAIQINLNQYQEMAQELGLSIEAFLNEATEHYFKCNQKNKKEFSWDDVEEVDEDIDDPRYKTLIDLREIDPDGVPAKDILKVMKKMEQDEQNRKISSKTK